MARTIEELYQAIAVQMSEAILEEWSRAWITVELVGESALDLVGHYVTAASAAPRAFRVPPSLVRDLAELRRRMQRPDTAAWRRATFSLTSDGQFNLDLEY